MISNKKIIYLFIMLFISNSNTLFIKLTNAVSGALLLLLNTVIEKKMWSIVLVVVCSFVVLSFAERPNELVLIGDEKIGEVIKTKITYKKASELPTNFDYRDLGLLSTDLNQHIPVYWYS